MAVMELIYKKVTGIYGLFDPRFPEVVMYVGKGLGKRALSHWSYFNGRGETVSGRLRRWFEKLQAEGIKPSWRFLEENVINWEERERYWIAYWREKNPDLCNVADGGNEWPVDSCKLGGDNLKKLYPDLAVKAGKKGAEKNSWKHVHKLHPDLPKQAGSKGGHRLKELYPDLASQCGNNPNSLAAFAKARTSENQRKRALIARHNQWHVRRNKPNPECQLCKPEFFDLWEGGHA